MRFDIIYIDPPWDYRVWSKKTGSGRCAIKYYPTMNINDIYSVSLGDIASKNCCLFLWATFPQLPEALQCIKRWGFTYKTDAFVWIKINKDGSPFMGLGYWTRKNVEVCYLATKGNPKRVNKGIPEVIISPRLRHSAKPPEVRDRIVSLMGDLPRIELFARETCPGWISIGNEITGNDIRVDLENLIYNNGKGTL